MIQEKYYLTREEIEHYQYMLNHGYEKYIVSVDAQKYIVFPVVDKEYVGIAWPTFDGNIVGVDIEADIVFSYYIPLQEKILIQIPNPKFKILLFPNAS